jgi:hypothetical protein
VKSAFEQGGQRLTPTSHPAHLLRKNADLYDQRNSLYGDNYKHFGFIMERLFPDGIKLSTPEDFNRFGVLVQIVSKMTRYASQFGKGGHADSLDDAAVYAMMLRELDLLDVAR